MLLSLNTCIVYKKAADLEGERLTVSWNRSSARLGHTARTIQGHPKGARIIIESKVGSALCEHNSSPRRNS